MPLTPDTLDNWTTFHAPTLEQKIIYSDIRDAEDACHNAIFNAIFCARNVATCGPFEPSAHYAKVNETARAFLVTIDREAPDSADKTAAFRCVRLARNAANEAITNVAKEHDTPIHAWVTADEMEREAHRQLVLARFQANSAIACGGK